MEKPIITCRGRNGYFQYDHHYVHVVDNPELVRPVVYIEIHSKKEGKKPPIALKGHPREVKTLLLDILKEIR